MIKLRCMALLSPPTGTESSKSWQPCRFQKSSKSRQTTLDHRIGRTERHSLTHHLAQSASSPGRKLWCQEKCRRCC